MTKDEKDKIFKFIDKNKLTSLTSSVTLIGTTGIKRLIGNMVTKEQNGRS